MSGIVTAQQTTAVSTPSRAPRPRLWAAVGLVLGVPLGYYGLAAVEGVSSRTDIPPASWPVTGTVVVGVLAIAVVVAVLRHRWRVAIAVATVLALPWTVLGLTFLFAFGMGLLLLPPALVWVPVLVSCSRALACDEAASGGPSVGQRRRRAAAWLASSAVGLLALVVVGARGLASTGRQPTDTFAVLALAAWVFLVLVLVGCAVVLVLVATRRWRPAATLALVLGISLAAAALMVSILGLTAVGLLSVPLLLGARNLVALSDAERVARAQGIAPLQPA